MVWYMTPLKYVSLVEIGQIVFDIWEAKIGYLTSCVSNTLAHVYFLAADTLLCVLMHMVVF